jgi:DNA-binding MarR family transcriptional regulator
MSSTPPFGTQIIGRTEKALNAILDRLLDDTNLTEPQWVTLTLTVASGGTIRRDELISRVAGALKVTDAEAAVRIDELATAELVDLPDDPVSPVHVTDIGRQLQSRIRGEVGRITERLWGDLPAEDLATAGRVLSTVLDRANGELARHEHPKANR